MAPCTTRILGKTMRDAVRSKERWKGAVRLPKTLALKSPVNGLNVCFLERGWRGEKKSESIAHARTGTGWGGAVFWTLYHDNAKALLRAA